MRAYWEKCFNYKKCKKCYFVVWSKAYWESINEECRTQKKYKSYLITKAIANFHVNQVSRKATQKNQISAHRHEFSKMKKNVNQQFLIRQIGVCSVRGIHYSLQHGNYKRILYNLRLQDKQKKKKKVFRTISNRIYLAEIELFHWVNQLLLNRSDCSTDVMLQ